MIVCTVGVLALLAIMSGSALAQAQDEACQSCGMKKSMYGHSWIVLEHEDGSKVGLCSIHCGAIQMALNIDKPVTKVTVGDYNWRRKDGCHDKEGKVGL
jgi:hypothetical protein